jgi:hypothetical protein
MFMMERTFRLTTILLILLAGCSRTKLQTEAARPVNLNKQAAESALKEIEKERAENREWLRSDPLSYLAAVDRIGFGEKHTLTIGSAADNDLCLGATRVEPHHLKVTVDRDYFQIHAVDANARFKIKEETKREATIRASSIQVGGFTLRLSDQRFPAIVVFDPQSRD